jgi:hypothetical protein
VVATTHVCQILKLLLLPRCVGSDGLNWRSWHLRVKINLYLTFTKFKMSYKSTSRSIRLIPHMFFILYFGLYNSNFDCLIYPPMTTFSFFKSLMWTSLLNVIIFHQVHPIKVIYIWIFCWKKRKVPNNGCCAWVNLLCRVWVLWILLL